MENITIQQIEYASEEYKLELKLRNQLLRQPIGLDLFDEDLSRESNDMHIGAFFKDKLIGVLLLTQLDDFSVKMRQVAVKEDFQRRGIGAQMVKYAEDMASSLGYKEIQLHSRVTAAGFYKKLGYTATGKEFLEIGVPHITMQKILE